MSIKEIAKKVGVSPSTVSRVLNNPNYHCHSKKLRDEIWNAAIELNYAPNQAAKNLKSGKGNQDKTFFINVLMTRMNDTHSDPFFDEILRVVESEIHRNMCILSKIWYQPMFSNDKKCKTANLDNIINSNFAHVNI